MNLPIRLLVCTAALAASVSLLAQEEAAATESSEPVKTETEAEEAKEAAKPSVSGSEKLFTVLPFCKRLEGRAEVMLPGATDWSNIEEGKFFPLGSQFRTCSEETRMEIAFGREAVVSVVGLASFGTRSQPLEIKSRTITLDSGTIELRLPLNFPVQMFCVTNAGFYVENPAGVSRYTCRSTGDGTLANVRCVSGVITVKGRHFEIPSMHAANEVEIRSSQDYLFTGLFGKSGDYLCRLDAGMCEDTDFESHEKNLSAKYINWKLSPRTAVRIFRKVPEVGSNLAVSVLTFDSNGELRNRCSFAERRPELNTGDQGPAVEEERERAAKALKEAAEKAEAAPAAEGEADKESSKESESKSEE